MLVGAVDEPPGGLAARLEGTGTSFEPGHPPGLRAKERPFILVETDEEFAQLVRSAGHRAARR
jgi:hypothetical protein